MEQNLITMCHRTLEVIFVCTLSLTHYSIMVMCIKMQSSDLHQALGFLWCGALAKQAYSYCAGISSLSTP